MQSTSINKLQLLCNFIEFSQLDSFIKFLSKRVPECKKVYLFTESKTSNSQYICTYNTLALGSEKIDNAISIHRKKETNTLYSLNALNNIIKIVNSGLIDRKYQLDWNQYQNSLLLGDHESYKKIDLELKGVVAVK